MDYFKKEKNRINTISSEQQFLEIVFGSEKCYVSQVREHNLGDPSKSIFLTINRIPRPGFVEMDLLQMEWFA